MKRILLSIFLLIAVYGSCQQNIGLPAITNYYKQQYGGGTQNWKIQTDSSGFVYFANNDGLLAFDGTFWKTFPLPNKTIVRSIALGSEGRIYAGGQDELGYFFPAKGGTLQYKNLKTIMAKEDSSFDDVWDIISLGKQVFFRVRQTIFHLDGQAMSSYKSANWRSLTKCNDQIYAQDMEKGLMVFDQGVFKPVEAGSYFTKAIIITGIVPYGRDSVLVATMRHGLYVLTEKSLTPLINPVNALERYSDITCITTFKNGYFALGTREKGVFIVDKNFRPFYHYNRETGMQNQTVLSLLIDKTDNIWIALDNGIDYIAHNDPILKILPETDNEGSGYSAIVTGNQLLMGTNRGLFEVALSNKEQLGLCQGPFKMVPGTKGQVWSLNEINGKIFMGHHEGAFVFEHGRMVQKDNRVGYWTFIPYQKVMPAKQIFAGTYRGVKWIDTEAGDWNKELASKSFESARFLVLGTQNEIWVSHPYKGIYSIQPGDGLGQLTLNQMEKKEGIASRNKNYVFFIRNKIIAVTSRGILSYDETGKKFIPDPQMNALIPFKNIRLIKEDPQGNLWVVYEKNLAVIDLEGKKPQIIQIPAFNNNLLNGFEFIYFYNKHNTIIGGEKGFYLLDYPSYKTSNPNIKPHISLLRVQGKEEKVIFEGFIKDNTNQTPIVLTADQKNIHFDFSAPSFGQQNLVEYSVQLQGYENSWSGWSKKTEKEFTNLPHGDFKFLVRTRDNLGHIAASEPFLITILPPWYYSNWAIAGYFLLFGFMVFLLHKYQERTILAAEKKHKEEQQRLKYLQQLEIDKSEKEIVKLRNEKLEAELELQNAELAATTMHLVQKGEIISDIKEEMLKITRNQKGDISPAELKRMIKALGEDEAIDSDWDNFAQHFDKVHSGFLEKLKLKFPDLSNGDMKLCTYLRMNMSSKEISQLMHITVKSVELSRYRLRKKLGLNHGENLYDFLMMQVGEG